MIEILEDVKCELFAFYSLKWWMKAAFEYIRVYFIHLSLYYLQCWHINVFILEINIKKHKKHMPGFSSDLFPFNLIFRTSYTGVWISICNNKRWILKYKWMLIIEVGIFLFHKLLCFITKKNLIVYL